MAAGPNKHRISPSGKTAVVRRTVTVSPGNVGTAAVKEVTAALSGASTSDVIAVNPTAAMTANVGICGARVSAAGVIAISFVNPTAAQIAAADVTLRVALEKFSN